MFMSMLLSSSTYVGFDGCQSLRCRSYVEYAAEQCQARVNSLVEALTEQGRTILTEVTTILKPFPYGLVATKPLMYLM